MTPGLLLDKDNSDYYKHVLLAQSIFLDSSITILDYYNVLKDAGDYHSSTHEGDCSHYCWNQHLWLPFWGMLETISRRRDQ
jgi:hypothetical protein